MYDTLDINCVYSSNEVLHKLIIVFYALIIYFFFVLAVYTN